MRFMLMVKANEESEAGRLPSTKELEAMGRFNTELVEAGVLLAGEGLQPSSTGARVRFQGKDRTVLDGPFAETKELLGGFWLIQARDLAEALEWAKRVPFTDGEIEIRRVSEAEDFGEDLTPELREQEVELRRRAEANG